MTDDEGGVAALSFGGRYALTKLDVPVLVSFVLNAPTVGDYRGPRTFLALSSLEYAETNKPKLLEPRQPSFSSTIP